MSNLINLKRFAIKLGKERQCHRTKQEDLKVLRRSPDLLNNVQIGQGQLYIIMEQILFYHIWGLQTFWSSDLNNLMNNPSYSPVIFENRCLDRCVAVQMSGLG